MPAGRPPPPFTAAAIVLAVLMAVLVAHPATARAAAAEQAAERGPCLAPAAIMRRDHMDMLKHDRTAAVHDGIRRPDRALENCVTCHAIAGNDGKPVSHDDSRHFCNSCHPQAAVAIDCFSCHRSTPSAGTAVVQPIRGGTAP